MVQAVAFLVRVIYVYYCAGGSVTACHDMSLPAGGAIDNGYHQQEGRIKSLGPGCQGPPANPSSHRRRIETFFWEGVRRVDR